MTLEHFLGDIYAWYTLNLGRTQVDERSPEERRTRLKKADSIRRMLAESQANQPIPSELSNDM